MKIEKGKLYYCLKDVSPIKKGELFKGRVDERFNQGHFTDKIAVHCPTEEDWKYVIEKYNIRGIDNFWDVYDEISYIAINSEMFGDIKNNPPNNHIITIDQFKQFYPQTEKQMTPTHFAISPEEYQEWQEYKNSNKVVIDYYRLKVGSEVKLKFTTQYCNGGVVDYSKPFQVVIRDSNYFIDSYDKTLSKAEHNDYKFITFIQEDVYIVFANDKIDYITEVISY